MDGRIFELQQHNASVFGQLYDECHSKVYFFVLKYTQSTFLAEETVQLSFIRLWEKADRLSHEVDIEVQLFRITKSVMIDLLRKESVRARHSLRIAETIANHETNDAENRFELLRIHQAIDNMAPVRKTVFRLSRIQGYSHIKIAEQLSISPKTVENHITKALRQLRRTLSSFLF